METIDNDNGIITAGFVLDKIDLAAHDIRVQLSVGNDTKIAKHFFKGFPGGHKLFYYISVRIFHPDFFSGKPAQTTQGKGGRIMLCDLSCLNCFLNLLSLAILLRTIAARRLTEE